MSPVSRDGSARAGANSVPGKAAADAGRRKRQTTYPELLASRRCRLVVLAVEVGGRFGAEMRRAGGLPPPLGGFEGLRSSCAAPADGASGSIATAGRECWLSPPSEPWLGRCWSSHEPMSSPLRWRTNAMALSRLWRNGNCQPSSSPHVRQRRRSAIRDEDRALQPELLPGEQALAYLDDVYMLGPPDRVAELYRRLGHHLWHHARLRLKA